MEEELAAQLADAHYRIHELEGTIDELSEEIINLESNQNAETTEAVDALDALKGPLARLLRMVDFHQLVLIDPAYALELREAREALRAVS